MPFLLPILLNFQGSAHIFGVGSFSSIIYRYMVGCKLKFLKDCIVKNTSLIGLRSLKCIVMQESLAVEVCGGGCGKIVYRWFEWMLREGKK